MIIGERLRQLRERKNFSQGDVEEKTGLLRCYVSRVENGHTIPSIETLEKWARALEVQLWQIFADENAPAPTKLGSVMAREKEDVKDVARFRRLLARMDDRDQKTLLSVAHAMARSAGRKGRAA